MIWNANRKLDEHLKKKERGVQGGTTLLTLKQLQFHQYMLVESSDLAVQP